MSLRASECGVGASFVLLLSLILVAVAHAADEKVSLAGAARQAIDSNLDLLAQRRALAAAREEVGLDRAALLPQVGIGARGQFLDDDRSDGVRGNNKQKSLLLAAGLSQTLYDEESWASFDIQKHLYAGQVEQLESFAQQIIQEAANAFLELERAQEIVEIQARNRDLTRDNLETSRSLVAAGWSSEQDILRWESQLASNDAAVRNAQASVLQNRFELNRVRNIAPESPVDVVPATIAAYGFVYAHEPIAQAIIDPENDRRMRDFLVELGIRRSPDLAAIDATIAGAERQLTASRRAFWVPTLMLAAGIDHMTTKNSGDDFNATEWGAKAELTFPLFKGGAKLASRDQALEALASQRARRRATARTLSQSIRAAFAQASSSFESVGYARRQVEAARRNFELVDASYTLGVDSILDLLDAQSQLLKGELSVTNATYDFLEDLVAAEREISFYAYLESPEEVEELLGNLERELAREPFPSDVSP